MKTHPQDFLGGAIPWYFLSLFFSSDSIIFYSRLIVFWYLLHSTQTQ
jgi:hypothetical protein